MFDLVFYHAISELFTYKLSTIDCLYAFSTLSHMILCQLNTSCSFNSITFTFEKVNVGQTWLNSRLQSTLHIAHRYPSLAVRVTVYKLKWLCCLCIWYMRLLVYHFTFDTRFTINHFRISTFHWQPFLTAIHH